MRPAHVFCFEAGAFELAGFAIILYFPLFFFRKANKELSSPELLRPRNPRFHLHVDYVAAGRGGQAIGFRCCGLLC